MYKCELTIFKYYILLVNRTEICQKACGKCKGSPNFSKISPTSAEPESATLAYKELAALASTS